MTVSMVPAALETADCGSGSPAAVVVVDCWGRRANRPSARHVVLTTGSDWPGLETSSWPLSEGGLAKDTTVALLFQSADRAGAIRRDRLAGLQACTLSEYGRRALPKDRRGSSGRTAVGLLLRTGRPVRSDNVADMIEYDDLIIMVPAANQGGCSQNAANDAAASRPGAAACITGTGYGEVRA